MSFGKSSKSQTQSTSQKTDPWAPAIPYLKSFLGDVDAAKGNLGPTGDQLDAFGILKQNAVEGMPFLDQIKQLGADQLGTTSRTGMVDEAYGGLKAGLADVAAGKNLDIMNDPRIMAMLKTVGDDVQNRIQGVFAGAGRDVSGNTAGQQAIGKGVTAAQLPILINEFARQQGRTDAAVRDIAQGGVTAASTGQALDKDALATRGTAIDTIKQYMAGRDLPANTILQLDEQLRNMPLDDLERIAKLFLPVAGLGSQGEGTSKTKGTGMTFGLAL